MLGDRDVRYIWRIPDEHRRSPMEACMSGESSGKPDAWKLARPVWGWGRGETPWPTPLKQLPQQRRTLAKLYRLGSPPVNIYNTFLRHILGLLAALLLSGIAVPAAEAQSCQQAVTSQSADGCLDCGPRAWKRLPSLARVFRHSLHERAPVPGRRFVDMPGRTWAFPRTNRSWGKGSRRTRALSAANRSKFVRRYPQLETAR